MNDFVRKVYRNNASIYKAFLFVITSIAIVYLFPKEGQFKYDYAKGKLWQYDNLYAPFDFAIQKTVPEIEKEKSELIENTKNYFVINPKIKDSIFSVFLLKMNAIIPSDSFPKNNIASCKSIGKSFLNRVYQKGFVNDLGAVKIKDDKDLVFLRKDNQVSTIVFSNFTKSKDVLAILKKDFNVVKDNYGKKITINILSEIIKPNVFFDEKYTEKALKENLKNISLTKGKVTKGELIILKGDIVEGISFNQLESFKTASKSQIWTKSSRYWIIFGYTVLVAITLLILLLFLKEYRNLIFHDNNKVTFIFFNILFMILIQTLVLKYNADYLYVVPISILPIVLKTFFDARLALFTHVLTVIMLGFVVPNSFEFIYLHIIAGIVTIFTVSELYKRANLFISIGIITAIYMLSYFAFSIIKGRNADSLEWEYFIMFAANGLLSFLAVFFIYSYEKIFGLVSDVTLLELSNTNTKLLRELNEKAPGTFQHSMQVANLAEAAANEIGANSMLTRVGALYHDIGKIKTPQYFIENQSTGVNPHNDLVPLDSAQIILDHVISGIEIAKKYNLPDRIIDFIRTHHGTSLVYYFYKKELDRSEDNTVDVKRFKYQGPIPFSKETAILMMCDASEAASRSLQNPTSQLISDLIDKIIEKQKSDNQFVNSDITFREIEKIKKVIKNKLMNIYHLRVEYPD